MFRAVFALGQPEVEICGRALLVHSREAFEDPCCDIERARRLAAPELQERLNDRVDAD